MTITELRAAHLDLVRRKDGVAIDLTVLQGSWTLEQYLKLTDSTPSLVEFTDGVIEVLPMPTDKHQSILVFLFLALRMHIHPLGGTVLFAALRLQIRPEKFREPDLILLQNANDPRRQNRYWLGADLVVEVVSNDDPERDTVDKVIDYAEAGIPEYWIVNPLDETITVLQFSDTSYRTHGVFRRGTNATSVLLNGFSVSVDATMDAR
jgi:Uma2 family endonuclease